MTRRGLLAMLALALGLGTAVLLVEGVLRTYASVADNALAQRLRSDPYAVLIDAHGEHGYRPQPGATFDYENGTSATINALGYRGPEVASSTPAGTTRIVLVGGSTTFGWGVNDDQTIDHYMREALARRYPDRRFEVVNLAMDGYDSWQILERLRSDGLPLDPDIVIVNTGVNDVRNARFPGLSQDEPDPRTLLWATETNRLREEAERGGPGAWTRARHWLYLARLPGILRQQARDPADTMRTPHPEAMAYFEGNLERIVQEVTASSALLLLSSDPSSLRTKYRPDDTSFRSYWLHDAATTQAYRDSLDARLRAVVDSAQGAGRAVALLPPAQIPPEHFLDDTHLTPAGNRLLAEHWVGVLETLLE